MLSLYYFYDEAGILPTEYANEYEEYLHKIFTESDIDIRFVFLKNIDVNTVIEDLAIEKMDKLGVGQNSREKRGVLFLYDLSKKKLRIEIAPGLESYFTDAFISYLVHFHARDFFESGDVHMGLRLTLFILHNRIRNEVLGNTFDPTIVKIIKNKGFLTDGAGVSSTMPDNDPNKSYWKANIRGKDKKYLPQDTPKKVYQLYLRWMAKQEFDPNIKIFTKESQTYLSAFPITKAYFHYVLMREYGQAYKIFVKNNIAMLIFTDNPLLVPRFFRKGEKGWQMDIIAEVKNTFNTVGREYSWCYSGKDDIYTKAFGNKLVSFGSCERIKGGDNRKLLFRGQ